MNSNLKKLFGFATIAACTFGFAMNVNAAVDADDSTLCTATTMAELKDCNSKKGDYKDVKTIDISGLTKGIEESITFKDMTIDGKTADITINSGVNVKLTDSKMVTTKDVKILSNATLDVTSDATNAIEAANVNVLKGKLIVSADNTNGVVANTENTANAVKATTLKVDGGILTVSKGLIDAATTVEGKSTITVDKVKGAITVDDANTEGNATIKANEVEGEITLVGKSTLTANKVKSVVAEDNSTANVKEITDTLTVKNAGVSVQYAGEDATVNVTEGIARQTKVNQYGETHVEVTAKNVDSVKLASNETLVIENPVTDIKKGFKIEAAKGALIDNQTGEDLNLNINGETVVVSKDAKDNDAYAVANGAETPVEPTDPTDPKDPTTPDKPNTGDDQPNKNPQTFDGILSYVGVALSSVGGLGVSLKKRLFR